MSLGEKGNNMISVSVIVPVYNRADLIGLVIEAILRQSYPPKEIIVVDDGSTDSTGEVVKRYPVRYIYQENRGPASARNRGFEVSSGEIVAFLDSDCIAREEWLENLIKGFDSIEVGAVAGSYDIANPEAILSRLIHEEIKWRHSRFKRFVRVFGSYNVAIRREVFKEVGGFDQSYRTASGEDNDLSYMILRGGYKIRFVQDALVAHYHTESLWKYLREQSRHAFWRVKLYKEHPEMLRGDDYTMLKDALEIPLAGLTILGLPVFLTPYWFVEAFITGILVLLSLPLSIRLTLKKRELYFLLIIPLHFIRAFARFLGAIKGALRFRLLR